MPKTPADSGPTNSLSDDYASSGDARRPNTKNSLLDAAEAVIAEQGVAGASLRAITRRAKANLAAANYHFGSKKALIRAVLTRHLRPLNQERLRLLEATENEAARSQQSHPSLESLVRAFLEPVVRFGHGRPDRGRNFLKIFGRAVGQPDPTLRSILVEELSEVIQRFSGAFSAALPHLSRKELMWRMGFIIGSMAQTIAGAALLEELSSGLCGRDHPDQVVDRLVGFAVAGLQAPATDLESSP